ncbi:hypothetical protein vseg_004792 [Gypsophila vaccaria]
MAARPEKTKPTEHEWEIVNDAGFIYQRKKRRLDAAALVAAASAAAASEAESELSPEMVLKERRDRKRKALLQIRDKYRREIALWEKLSDSVKSVEARHRPQFAEERECGVSVGGEDNCVGPVTSASSLLSDLFLQVEAQEAIIRECSQLCEIAESLCSAHEEKTKQQFIDLPIWKSPEELMASLCDD